MKTIITSLALLLASFYIQAQTITYTISGYVTNAQTGAAINNHAVYISSDSTNNPSNYYWNTVYTNANGYYSDNVSVIGGILSQFHVSTADCNGSYQTVNLTTNNIPLTANFAICDSINTTNCNASFYAIPDSMNSGGTTGSIWFVDNSTGSPTSWFWDFGDGSTSNLQYSQHIYQNLGIYNVCLTISTASGCTSTYCDSILVDSVFTPNCYAAFQYTAQNANYTFTAYTNCNAVTGYSWDFGDSTTGNGQSITHSYTNYGSYYVCLTISDLNGYIDTYCQYINYTPFSNSTLCGQVFAGSNYLDAGNAYLIGMDRLANSYSYTAIANVDSTGYYCFGNVPAGTYIAIAFPSQNSIYYNDYLPTYYGDVINWSDAVTFYMGNSSTLTGYDIHLIYTNGPVAGNGSISGVVVQGGNKIAAAGDPIQNVEVLLLDASDNPLAATFTNANGGFSFTDLAFGTYKIYGEYAGLIATSAIVELNAATISVDNVQVNVGSGTIVASVNEHISESIATVSNIYPNPSAGELNLRINALKNTNVNISITDMYGKCVYNTFLNAAPGSNVFSINTDNFSTGIYSVQIVSDSDLAVYRMFEKIK